MNFMVKFLFSKQKGGCMHVDMNNFEEVVQLKNYQLYAARFQKRVVNGSETAMSFFRSLIINANDDVHVRRQRVLAYLATWAANNNYLSENDLQEVILLIDKKKKQQLEQPEVNLNNFFKHSIKIYKALPDEEVSKKETLAIIITPLLLGEALTNLIPLKYSDIKVHEIEDTAILAFKTDKKSHKVLLKKELACVYIKILNSLRKKYGEDDALLYATSEDTWTLSKASILMYNSYRDFITDKTNTVKDTTFVTLLKRELKNKRSDFFQSI